MYINEKQVEYASVKMVRDLNFSYQSPKVPSGNPNSTRNNSQIPENTLLKSINCLSKNIKIQNHKPLSFKSQIGSQKKTFTCHKFQHNIEPKKLYEDNFFF